MRDRPVSAHSSHDLELVARAAAGDLVAGETTAAHELLATCEACAGLAADLHAIAAATRELGSVANRAATPAATTAAPRDFRLTEADAARLRHRGIRGLARPGAWGAGWSRGLGGALTAVGLIGLLVTAGLPAFSGGAASLSAGTELGAGGPDEDASPIAAMGPAATDAYQLTATGDPSRALDTVRERSPSTIAPSAAVAAVSAGLLLLGLALLLFGRARRQAGP